MFLSNLNETFSRWITRAIKIIFYITEYSCENIAIVDMWVYFIYSFLFIKPRDLVNRKLTHISQPKLWGGGLNCAIEHI